MSIVRVTKLTKDEEKFLYDPSVPITIFSKNNVVRSSTFLRFPINSPIPIIAAIIYAGIFENRREIDTAPFQFVCRAINIFLFCMGNNSLGEGKKGDRK